MAGSSLVLLDAFLERFFIAPKAICLDIVGAHWNVWSSTSTINRVTSIRTAVLRPLLAFRNLRKLDFRAYQNYTLRWDDAVLLQMAKSWPLLEVLHLNRYDHSSRGVTPSAFASLLRHCPCLISVAIIVNWSTIDECDVSPDAPHRGSAHKALSEAFFGSPRIRHPTRIAAFLSAIAPNLESIVIWDPQFGREQQDSKKYINRWKCVCDLIKAFSVVCEQVRRMVLNAGEGVDGNESSYNHHGITQPAYETENGDAAIGEGDNGEDGEVSEEDSGSESESEYTSDESSEE
ncbi:uncharacterized protein BJ212DRAFT_1480441 [Suillus subaureus]|uniref:F-box domain-containing protein n=1 Tax=Suillus subaureus TaxID=48587 RepID=A0A9P7ECC4_9AGAM|nr:uncharacterized protein BJ212DRAFT_1480441 [Suillus subaureus]KAG1817215.1 hypothetical protein BJ212DRAFT_1480441 [Suillus subaureus]